MRLSRIASLIWKELLAVLCDRRSRISIFLPPLIQLLLFAYAATLDVKNVPIGILNRDTGERAFELVQRFHGTPSRLRTDRKNSRQHAGNNSA